MVIETTMSGIDVSSEALPTAASHEDIATKDNAPDNMKDIDNH